MSKQPDASSKKKEYDQWYEKTEGAKCTRRKYNKTPERKAELDRRIKIYRAPKDNPAHFEKYTNEECKMLIDCTFTVSELAELLGRSVPAIIRKRGKLKKETKP